MWRWREQYPLGGDEREYFNQALTLLREHRYEDLPLMRPPLYTFFLAGCTYLFDSLVQRLRLIQEIVGALTVVPVYLLTLRLFGRPAALVASLLLALSYTLAANATELLTETLFLFGLAWLFWLLLVATDDRRSAASARGGWLFGAASWGSASVVLAGICLGALTLLRSVALPLVPLGALWLLLRVPSPKPQRPSPKLQWSRALVFAVAAMLTIAPWTARNYLTYGALILVDTTGAENLWLDNNPAGATPGDPLGREAAKRQLYGLGDDRAARQRLATERGLAALAGNPGWFAQKAAGQAKKFVALQYFDDMRERRAIWVPPAEVWLRLLLGDGLWLAVLVFGAAGLWLAPTDDRRPMSRRLGRKPWPAVGGRWLVVGDPRWLFVAWALYTLLTALIFHVELRYRLPLYPVLIPYAAWAICRITDRGSRIIDWVRSLKLKTVCAALTILLLSGMTLLHRPYVSESWMLVGKHYELWRAERALDAGDAAAATQHASAALRRDPDSALARLALARADLLRGDRSGALDALDQAVEALPAHPLAHLLRGALLRERGDPAEARKDLAYERASLQDLQRWSWQVFAPLATVPPAADVGGGLDLGFVRGFHLPEESFRWSTAEAQVLLAAPTAPSARLRVRLAAGRPAGAPLPSVTIAIGGTELGRIAPANGWATYDFAAPAGACPSDRRCVVTLRSDTFRPRDLDRSSADGRALGVMVGRVEIIAS